MMAGGLFDALMAPENRLGIAMLANAGPSAQPISLGQRLAASLGMVQAQQDGDLKAQLIKSQIGENQSQEEQRRAAVQRQKDLAKFWEQFAGNSGAAIPQAFAPGSMTGDAGTDAMIGGGAPASTPAPARAGGSRIANMTPDQIAMIEGQFGVKLLPVWEAANKIQTVAPGATAVPSNGAAPWVAPNLEKNQQIGPGGVVSNMPGSVGAVAEMTAAQERAKVAAQAGGDLVTLNLPSGPVQVTRAQALAMTQPQAPAPVRAPMPAPASGGGYGTESQMRGQAQAPLGKVDTDAAIAAVRAAMPGMNPAARAEAERTIAGLEARPLGGAPTSSGPGIPLMSPDEQIRRNAQATADVSKGTEDKENMAQMRNMLNDGAEALRILRADKATSSMAGKTRDTVAGWFGHGTEGAQAAADLNVVAARLSANVPKFSGPTSNYDAQQYAKAAGQAGDETVPTNIRASAIETMMRLIAKEADVKGYDLTDKKGRQPGEQQAAAAPAGRMVDALPTANASNKGKTATDTETGQRFRSNGLQWVKVQ